MIYKLRACLGMVDWTQLTGSYISVSTEVTTGASVVVSTAVVDQAVFSTQNEPQS